MLEYNNPFEIPDQLDIFEEAKLKKINELAKEHCSGGKVTVNNINGEIQALIEIESGNQKYRFVFTYDFDKSDFKRETMVSGVPDEVTQDLNFIKMDLRKILANIDNYEE